VSWNFAEVLEGGASPRGVGHCSVSLAGCCGGGDVKGSQPLALVTQNLAKALTVVPAPQGFVAATCSSESKPEWINLNREFDVAGGSSLVAPDAPCSRSIFWTGEAYLSTFTDSRGLVVASRDEQGAPSSCRIDDAGEVLYNESKKVERDDPFVYGVVVDPLRDLVVKPSIMEGSEPTIVIQEYGCLN
jgi:hypothetical protein